MQVETVSRRPLRKNLMSSPVLDLEQVWQHVAVETAALVNGRSGKMLGSIFGPRGMPDPEKPFSSQPVSVVEAELVRL